MEADLRKETYVIENEILENANQNYTRQFSESVFTVLASTDNF